MGGLNPVSEPTGVSRIRDALDEQQNGSSSAFHKLQYTVARGTSAEVTELLLGLTHFAYMQHGGSTGMRQLLTTALNINFDACISVEEGPDAMAALLAAYSGFVHNLVSAHVTFVEPALVAFAKRAFVLTSVVRKPVMECVLTMVPLLLTMHPQATDVLARVVHERHPHQVRPGPELAAYMRAVLELAHVCNSETLRRSIIFTVVEKLLAIDALVPAEYVESVIPTDDDTKMEVDNESTGRRVSFASDSALCEEAEKMDLVLAEVLQFLDGACKSSGDSFAASYVEPIYFAFQRYVLPQQGARFVPYVLFYAVSLAGPAVSEDISERLRQSFFDSSLYEENRSVYLRFSCGIIARCNTISARFCLGWMNSLALWLNRYTDPLAENGFPSQSDLYPGNHVLFYTAVSCLLKTITLRPDALDPSLTQQRDALAQMRLFRVLLSPLTPTFYVSSSVVSPFCDLAWKSTGVDWREALRESEYRQRFRKTVANAGMVDDVESLAPLVLFGCSSLMSKFYREAKDVPEIQDDGPLSSTEEKSKSGSNASPRMVLGS